MVRKATYLDGDKVRESEVIDFAETMPFFADYRLIRIKDSGLLKSGSELLPDYMKNIPEHAVIVFSETEVDKRSRLFKAIKNAGYISEFAEQKEAALMKWGAGLLGKSGLRISANNMRYLLSRTGPDMSHLSLEIDKLVNYCHGRTAVERDDIEAVTRILYLIGRQYNQLLIIKELLGEGNSSSLIAQKSGIHPYAVQKLTGITRSFSRDDLQKSVNACVAMEEAVKTGQIGERLSVELILLGAAGK